MMLIALVLAEVVKANKDLPVIPPGQEDSHAAKGPDPLDQADGKVVQKVSWDVAEDFNLARAKARERRQERMAQQQAMAAKAQAEAEAKVQEAWEKNAYPKGKPKKQEPSSTVVHLVRKPRPRGPHHGSDHVRLHANRTTNSTNSTANRTSGITNASNVSTSGVEKTEPALDGLDHIADKVAQFGQALEAFTKAQAGKGKKGRKLPPQVEKIMENAEDLMKKIIAVADNKSVEVPDVKAEIKRGEANETSRAAALHYFFGGLTNASVGSNAEVASGGNATLKGDANATSTKNITNRTGKVAAQAVQAGTNSNNRTATAMPISQKTTKLINATDKNWTVIHKNASTEAVRKNTSDEATVLSKSATQTAKTFPTIFPANTTGSTPGPAPKKMEQIDGHTTRKDPPTHVNKPEHMVHSALGTARLAAAKLRGMRAHMHKPAASDDSWKFRNAEIDSRIVDLKAAKEDAKNADDQDLEESLQEKINQLQAEADENKAKAEKVKNSRRSS